MPVRFEQDGELLSDQSVVQHLRRRGLLPADRPAEARPLSGGVSNVVLSVRAQGIAWVVKQSLGRLDVPGEWLATRERTLIEAAALERCREITPDAVPRVVDLDADEVVLVIEQAPDGWGTLKDLLLEGCVPAWAFEELGVTLAAWHTATRGLPVVLGGRDDALAFRQLRTDPFHRRVAEVHPDLAEVVLSCVAELEQQRRCLVHGDFSPKNVLVGTDRAWVIDFEVAHIGAPVFDVAFLMTHLLLKAAHRPASLPAYAHAAAVFQRAYTESVAADLAAPTPPLAQHVGCLLLARVDGLSVAPYLSPAAAAHLRSLGRALLLGEGASVEEAFGLLGHLCRG